MLDHLGGFGQACMQVVENPDVAFIKRSDGNKKINSIILGQISSIIIGKCLKSVSGKESKVRLLPLMSLSSI